MHQIVRDNIYAPNRVCWVQYKIQLRVLLTANEGYRHLTRTCLLSVHTCFHTGLPTADAGPKRVRTRRFLFLIFWFANCVLQ